MKDIISISKENAIKQRTFYDFYTLKHNPVTNPKVIIKVRKRKNIMEIKVFVEDRTAHVEGIANGKWFTLPVKDVEKDIIKEVVLEEGHTTFITDYEADFKIGELTNLQSLNKLAEELEEFDGLEDLFWVVMLDSSNLRYVREFIDVNDIDEFFASLGCDKPSQVIGHIGSSFNFADDYIYCDTDMQVNTMSKYQFQEYVKSVADKILEVFCKENDL